MIFSVSRSGRARLLPALILVSALPAFSARIAETASPSISVRVGTFHIHSPYGLAMIVDDATAFLLNPEFDERSGASHYGPTDVALIPPPAAAPDFSIVKAVIPMKGAKIAWTWGRVGQDSAAACLETDKPARLTLRLSSGWPRFHGVFNAVAGGIDGYGIRGDGRYVPFRLRCAPQPAVIDAFMTGEGRIVVDLEPGRPFVLTLGLGELPAPDSVPGILKEAEARFETARPKAGGAWGDFLGAMSEVLTASRLYGSDNGRVVHGIGRGWWIARSDPDRFPYFEWDLFFHGAMSAFEDPAAGRETIRANFSYMTPDGFVPSYSHWDVDTDAVAFDRSMPPVGAMCVWKLHERWPDRAFLEEVYPKLVQWHAWWPKARDANGNGLLEWGSDRGVAWAAWMETGWDDNVHFEGAEMRGPSLNADAVDLSSLWSLDAEYLARIAEALGKEADVRFFRDEQAATNRRINERLWNESLGIYCSRFWEVPEKAGEAIPPSVVFPGGVEVETFKDRDLLEPLGRGRLASPDFEAGKNAFVPDLPGKDWSARWTAVLKVPVTGRYRLVLDAADGARMWVDGKLAADRWNVFPEARNADLVLEAGADHAVRIETFCHEGPARLRLTVRPLAPGRPGDDWLTRPTPMNYYPLACGAPDEARAARILAHFRRPDMFWGRWVVPTVAFSDPVWSEQSYWRGNIWPPANYLLWQGLKRYAPPDLLAAYAGKCLELFMTNWMTERRVCAENYKSSDGGTNGHPHYTWSALLCLIGAEALADAGPDLKPVARPLILKEPVILRGMPFGGKTYTIEAGGDGVKITEEQSVPASIPAAAAPAPKPDPWAFAVGLSYLGTSGNTRTQQVGADFSFKRLPEPWGIDGAFSYIRGFEKGETTIERSRAGAKGSRKIRDGWDCFLSGTGERDRFSGYDSRLSLAAGATLRAVASLKNELSLDAGLSWNADNSVVGDVNSYPGGYFQTGFTHNWTATSKFQQRLLYVPNFAEGARWRGESESAVIAALLNPLAFKGFLLVRFNNEPPAGYKKVDTTTALSFVYSF